MATTELLDAWEWLQAYRSKLHMSATSISSQAANRFLEARKAPDDQVWQLQVYQHLVIKAASKPVGGNQDGSYLTFFSSNGLVFGIINIIGTFFCSPLVVDGLTRYCLCLIALCKKCRLWRHQHHWCVLTCWRFYQVPHATSPHSCWASSAVIHSLPELLTTHHQVPHATTFQQLFGVQCPVHLQLFWRNLFVSWFAEDLINASCNNVCSCFPCPVQSVWWCSSNPAFCRECHLFCTIEYV